MPKSHEERESIEPAADSRREFLIHLLTGTASATVLLVYGAGAFSGAQARQEGYSEHARDGEPDHDYAYVVDVAKCIGCGNCVRACKLENSVPDKLFRTWVERYVLTNVGIHIDSPDGAIKGFEELNAEIRNNSRRSHTVPKMCNHCRTPPCVQVCPVGATFQSPEGFVLIDYNHCIGCGYCVQACPYGARFINPDKHMADKCTWCYHRVKRGKLPACVTVCPTRTRLFGDLNDPESEVAKIFDADKWMILRPEMDTEPFCFYVGLPREAR